MPIKSYRDLDAWQQAMDFVVSIYGLTRSFPPEELYGMTSQLRRAAVSIPSNVSEGHPQGTKVYRRFVTMALGSLAEAQTQLELARRLRLSSEEQLALVEERALHLRRLLFGLKRSLSRRLRQSER